MENLKAEKRLELQKSFWSDAARYGGLTGLLLFVPALIEGVMELGERGGYITFMSLVILALCIFTFGRLRSLKYGDLGFTFGQSMGYILAMMLFTGIITGVGNYFLHNFIAPAYYDAMFDQAVMNNPMINIDSTEGEQLAELLRSFSRKPLALVFSGIFFWMFSGGVTGIAASVFIRRKPGIFAGAGDADNQ